MNQFERLILGIATALFVLIAWGLMAQQVAMINVDIYRMEDGSFIYCASGSLTDPPATHIGTGAVPAGDESYC